MKLIIALIGAATLLLSSSAQNINTYPLWNGANYINAWGANGTASYGESFTATPSQNNLLSMTFSINAANSSSYNFRAYVFRWTGSDTLGAPLFTSAITPAPTSVGTFVPVIVNTGGLNLTPGQQYVAFYSVNGLGNTNGGIAEWAYLGTSAAGGFDGYTGGNFVFNNNLDTTFAGGWQNPTYYGGLPAHDLAFQFNFVPEPSAFALASLGALGLALRFRNSSKA